ncbi:SDR family NAD(P)-dependent oxidoreductase [Natronosalvus halobius]|uniref:SDR family NAD(P)-dependent oxidoreductase n=1 Tax=Natronosalvus halobius TaxID=2953746 RepID=UPI00209F18FD|nr:glucose 1-dehydrogenase [Natronosalvus halobius]USZ73697.1 glucose 1-dehydrogenase [Natronosalvus halobius]
MPAAIVTGSSRGIGSAIAKRFAKDGYNVVVNYRRSAEAAERTAAEIRDGTDAEALVVQADVSNPNDVKRLIDRTIDAFGGVDHVVNNAGIEESCPTLELDVGDFDRVMDTNVNSAFAVSQRAAPHLAESAEPAPSITNLSTFLALRGYPNEPHYVSSKAAILGLTGSLALDFAPDIRVNAIAPGHVETDMTDRSKMEENRASIPLGRYGQVDEIADAAAYLRDASYVTGETLRIDGGASLQ